MDYMNTTFAHGNGPFSRCVEWAVEVNNVREERELERLQIVVPLIYDGRQQRIMKEELGDWLNTHPDEILLDRVQGKLLERILFKGADYAENLARLVSDYQTVEDDMHEHLDGKYFLKNLDDETVDVKIDFSNCILQLGLNNRMQTGLPNQFYTAGGAGPFDELLNRAIIDPGVELDNKLMRDVLPIAKRMIEDQKIIFSNEPGVFSYDDSRLLMPNEKMTPPFIHPPTPNDADLPGKGIYLTATGIDGLRESGMYNAVADLRLQIYAPEFTKKGLPDSIRDKVYGLNPKQMYNPNIVAQYARAGWSSVWLSHLCKIGFISPAFQEADDPEMIFNERGIRKLGLGAIIGDDPRAALEESIELAKNVGKHNARLHEEYGTLDGIRYAAEIVVNEMGWK